MDFKLRRLYEYIGESQKDFVERLKKFVSIKSVSTSKELRPQVVKAIRFVSNILLSLGAEVKLNFPGRQLYYDGEMLELPPIILATLGKDLRKTTILVYGHVDVKDASLDEGWSSDPWALLEAEGNLYGRGATDNKGPLLAWMHALMAFQKLNIEVPVNVKFVIEGMEEAGSEGLAETLYDKKIEFLKSVDYVVMSDSFWLGTRRPCISYGVRGLTYFFVEVVTSNRHLHSGTHGGAISEAMNDCVYLLSTLVDHQGQILVPGLYDDVIPFEEDEAELYLDIDFTTEDYCDMIGVKKTIFNNEVDVLRYRWREPCLSMHGMEHAFNQPGGKAKIPRKVVGKFSIRIAPTQDPKTVVKLVKEHLEEKFLERDYGCLLNVLAFHNGKPWTTNPETPYFEAACRAVKRVWDEEPDVTREGASIPVMAMLQKVVDREMLMMPISSADDCPHEAQEKISKRNFIQGTKQMAAFMFEVADM